MSSCCHSDSCAGTNKFFSRWSKTYAKQFKKKGLEKLQKYLVDSVKREIAQPKRILDIGCGVGALHLTLLKEGAERGVGIDVAEGMINQARMNAKELGVEDRVEYILNDFVQVADSVESADVTFLDKVVCCYENLEALLRTSMQKTDRVYALTHPRDNWFVRFGFKAHIAILKLFRAKFHPSWHDWIQMDETIRAGGFQLAHEHRTIMWHARVYRRI